MKKLIIIFSLLLFALVLKKSFFISKIQGVYINTNYKGSRISPTFPDTLILMKDGQIRSDYFGNGYYELDKNMWRVGITLFKENGDSYFSTRVKKNLFGQTKIMISTDHSHYYLKIN